MQFSGCDNDWTIFHLRFVWLIESSQDEDQDRLIFIFFEACADSAFSNAFFDWFSKLFILFTLIIMWQKWHQNLAWLRPQRAKPHRSRELVLNATALPGHSDRKICFAEKKVLKLPTTADNLNVGPKFPHFVVCLSSADGFLLLCGCYHDSQKSHRLASLYVEMFHRAKE